VARLPLHLPHPKSERDARISTRKKTREYVITVFALYLSWRLLRRVSLELVTIVVAVWQAGVRLAHQLWRLEERRRDGAAIEALIAR
jgi:hypothetical protein